MQIQNIKDFYNTTANAYADNLFTELDGKPLDRMLLERFARQYHKNEVVLDLGCGPGQTTRFLYEHGATNIIGIDISEGMIENANRLNPIIQFEVGDMLDLKLEENFFDGIVAFYAIVHFTKEQLKTALQEVYHVLKSDGQFLFSFHVGDGIKEVDELFDVKAKAIFYFFEVEEVLEMLKAIGFKMYETVIRYPYADAEYPSKRAYITVVK